VLQIEGLTKRFGSLTALDELALTLAPGETHGFIGPNGAGKTTTFSLIAGFLRPDAGTIRITGHAAGEVAALRGVLGILPQDALLPAKDTVGSALTFYARLQGFSRADALAEAKRWLEKVGMSSSWGARCGTLSHGMAKRVGIAQAFLGNPKLVLLDEPTAGLDPKSAHQLRELIREVHDAGTTLLISSHNLNELEALCDSATVLERGRVRTQGTLTEMTSALSQIRIQIASDSFPEEALRQLWVVHEFTFDRARRTLAISLTAGLDSPEAGIAEILKFLLQAGVPISGLSKGQGLEASVISLKG
jgi:ABC-type multidrug transport system ATPase subunit